jgi:hypothetical protein
MFKITGLDEMQRKVKELERRLQSLDGTHSEPMEDLFPPEFMQSYTDFGTFGELMDASGFKVESQEDFDNLPAQEWKEFISSRTHFEDWQEMLSAAGKEWAARQLKL